MVLSQFLLGIIPVPSQWQTAFDTGHGRRHFFGSVFCWIFPAIGLAERVHPLRGDHLTIVLNLSV
jgi:hypothetical protein